MTTDLKTFSRGLGQSFATYESLSLTVYTIRDVSSTSTSLNYNAHIPIDLCNIADSSSLEMESLFSKMKCQYDS